MPARREALRSHRRSQRRSRGWLRVPDSAPSNGPFRHHPARSCDDRLRRRTWMGRVPEPRRCVSLRHCVPSPRTVRRGRRPNTRPRATNEERTCGSRQRRRRGRRRDRRIRRQMASTGKDRTRRRNARACPLSCTDARARSLLRSRARATCRTRERRFPVRRESRKHPVRRSRKRVLRSERANGWDLGSGSRGRRSAPEETRELA